MERITKIKLAKKESGNQRGEGKATIIKTTISKLQNRAKVSET